MLFIATCFGCNCEPLSGLLNAVCNVFLYQCSWKARWWYTEPKHVAVNELIYTGVACDWFGTCTCDMATPTAMSRLKIKFGTCTCDMATPTAMARLKNKIVGAQELHPGEGKTLSTRPDRPWGSPHHLYPGYWVIPEGKEAEAWLNHPLPSGAEVKERVELYLSFPSGPSWLVVGWKFISNGKHILWPIKMYHIWINYQNPKSVFVLEFLVTISFPSSWSPTVTMPQVVSACWNTDKERQKAANK